MRKYWKHSVKEYKTEFLELPLQDADDLRKIVKDGLPSAMHVRYGFSKVYRGKQNEGPDVYVREDGRMYSEKNSQVYKATLNHPFTEPVEGVLTVAVDFLDRHKNLVRANLVCNDGSKVVKIYLL